MLLDVPDVVNPLPGKMLLDGDVVPKPVPGKMLEALTEPIGDVTFTIVVPANAANASVV